MSEHRETKSRYEIIHKKNYVISIITFIFSICCCTFLINQLRVSDELRQRNHARNLIESVGYNTQAVLKEYFDITLFWSGYVAKNGGEVKDFALLSSAFYETNSTINTIQLAPRGIISYVYPEPTESVPPVDLFSDPIHRDDAKYSRLTRLTTVTGPFDLVSGGRGIAIKSPIYVSAGENMSEFWGFSVVTIGETNFFQETHLRDLEIDEYEYQLKAINPSKGKLEMVACSTEGEIEKPVTYTFDVHNTAWTFSVAPKVGWTNKSLLLFELFVGFFISLLLAFSANSFASLLRREDAFKQLSYIDMLTKLSNTRKFYETLSTLQRKGSPFAILYIDLNDFKPVNDLYGHKSGDDLLSIVAKKMLKCVREGDGVFRIGGDEFSIIIPNAITINGLNNLAGRLKASIGRETALENAAVTVGASIGYARCPEDCETYEEAILRAEAMMYADKKASKAGR